MQAVPTAASYGLTCAPLVIAWMAIDRKHMPQIGRLLYLVLGVMLYAMVAPAILSFESSLAPLKYDATLYRLDALMGFNAYRFAGVMEPVYTPLAVAYSWLAVVLTIWCGLHAIRPWGQYRAFVTAVSLAFGAASILYLIVPACGPAFAEPAALNRGGLLRILDAPNAIPSLHMTTALLMLYFSSGYARWFAAIFAAMTAMATIAVGQHYLIDLIVALPFACAVIAASLSRWRVAVPALAGVVVALLGIRSM